MGETSRGAETESDHGGAADRALWTDCIPLSLFSCAACGEEVEESGCAGVFVFSFCFSLL